MDLFTTVFFAGWVSLGLAALLWVRASDWSVSSLLFWLVVPEWVSDRLAGYLVWLAFFLILVGGLGRQFG